ncbi:hypothetical protein CA265_10490 [Sphingobacteriaceae bacterium GW460-11-11-14-LB5]|nr:hypothetical protein CA265_10490 [Sphingobacteriaceae bacterium GW460-11-11-14-LB5]
MLPIIWKAGSCYCRFGLVLLFITSPLPIKDRLCGLFILSGLYISVGVAISGLLASVIMQQIFRALRASVAKIQWFVETLANKVINLL